MTIVYIFQNPSSRICGCPVMFPRMASVMRRWAVELTGKNSVNPSTTPRITDKRYGFTKLLNFSSPPPAACCRCLLLSRHHHRPPHVSKPAEDRDNNRGPHTEIAEEPEV